MKRTLITAALAGIALLVPATAASASVTMDDAGFGFVGKGDVQTVLGLNNAQMQKTPVSFTQKTVTEQSFDWTCVKVVVTGNGNVNEIVQERANVTTTDSTGVVSNEARVKNQITGYNLTGLGATTTTTVTDGPAVGSCPNANSTFVEGSMTEGAPTVLSQGLFVNGVSLPITPAALPVL